MSCEERKSKLHNEKYIHSREKLNIDLLDKKLKLLPWKYRIISLQI